MILRVMDNIVIANGWIGSGESNFPEAYGEQLDLLGPVRVERGY
jgi:acetoacetate decarboxylase